MIAPFTQRAYHKCVHTTTHTNTCTHCQCDCSSHPEDKNKQSQIEFRECLPTWSSVCVFKSVCLCVVVCVWLRSWCEWGALYAALTQLLAYRNTRKPLKIVVGGRHSRSRSNSSNFFNILNVLSHVPKVQLWSFSQKHKYYSWLLTWYYRHGIGFKNVFFLLFFPSCQSKLFMFMLGRK